MRYDDVGSELVAELPELAASYEQEAAYWAGEELPFMSSLRICW